MRNSRKKKDESEIVKIPGGMPQIIEPEIYNQVQELMNNRRQRPPSGNRAKAVYILTGLMVCGVCGAPYVGNSRGGKPPVYRCTGRKRGDNCHNKHVNKYTIEQAAIDLITKQAKCIDPKQYATNYNKYVEEYVSDSKEIIKQLGLQIKSLQRKEENLLSALEVGGEISALTDHLKKISQEKEQLERQLNAIKRDIDQHRVTPKEITAIIEAMTPDATHADKKNAMKLKKIILKVTIHPNGRSEIYSRFEENNCNEKSSKLEEGSRLDDRGRIEMVSGTRHRGCDFAGTRKGCSYENNNTIQLLLHQ